MPYYGDYYAGDPGLFGFVKKIKLGRIVGGLVKSAFPGAAGVLSAVQAIRGNLASSKPGPSIPPISNQLTVAVPSMEPGKSVVVTKARARRARATGATFTSSGKAESPFAKRMRLARIRASRRRRGFER
jgi:hypothetical protein